MANSQAAAEPSGVADVATKLPSALEFKAAHRASKARSRARQAAWAAVLAIFLYNGLLAANFAGGQILAAYAGHVLIASQLLITLPCAIAAWLCQRNRDPLRQDLFMLTPYALAVLGSLFINSCMIEQARPLDMMSQAMIPVVFNIVVPLSFRAALGSSAVGVAMQTSYCTLLANFAEQDLSQIIAVNSISAALALMANYRFERAERIHFGDLMRENAKNQEIARANAALAALSRTDYLTGVARNLDGGWRNGLRQGVRGRRFRRPGQRRRPCRR